MKARVDWGMHISYAIAIKINTNFLPNLNIPKLNNNNNNNNNVICKHII